MTLTHPMMVTQMKRSCEAVGEVSKVSVFEDDVGKREKMTPSAIIAVTSQRIQVGTNRPLGKRAKTRR